MIDQDVLVAMEEAILLLDSGWPRRLLPFDYGNGKFWKDRNEAKSFCETNLPHVVVDSEFKIGDDEALKAWIVENVVGLWERRFTPVTENHKSVWAFEYRFTHLTEAIAFKLAWF